MISVMMLSHQLQSLVVLMAQERKLLFPLPLISYFPVGPVVFASLALEGELDPHVSLTASKCPLFSVVVFLSLKVVVVPL